MAKGPKQPTKKQIADENDVLKKRIEEMEGNADIERDA